MYICEHITFFIIFAAANTTLNHYKRAYFAYYNSINSRTTEPAHVRCQLLLLDLECVLLAINGVSRVYKLQTTAASWWTSIFIRQRAYWPNFEIICRDDKILQCATTADHNIKADRTQSIITFSLLQDTINYIAHICEGVYIHISLSSSSLNYFQDGKLVSANTKVYLWSCIWLHTSLENSGANSKIAYEKKLNFFVILLENSPHLNEFSLVYKF